MQVDRINDVVWLEGHGLCLEQAAIVRDKLTAALMDYDAAQSQDGEVPGNSHQHSNGADMPVRTKRPRLTVASALFIKMMAQYSRLAYRLTLLEVQKLAYFLQESGEPLRLNFEEGHYGPYAHNLNKVLEVLEGHYISGYGDTQKPDVEIALQPDAAEEANAFLTKHEESRRRLQRVVEVIDGFETPYGMELLSAVHWVAAHREPPARNADDTIGLVKSWNNRKRRLFQEKHMRLAWNRLVASGLVGAAKEQTK